MSRHSDGRRCRLCLRRRAWPLSREGQYVGRNRPVQGRNVLPKPTFRPCTGREQGTWHLFSTNMLSLRDILCDNLKNDLERNIEFTPQHVRKTIIKSTYNDLRQKCHFSSSPFTG
ncbi:MAG: hypothetical protein LBS01_03255 [Prevotellaceae bacterium]|nr:hypothetical protein [Prevotellaceae bacterium]